MASSTSNSGSSLGSSISRSNSDVIGSMPIQFNPTPWTTNSQKVLKKFGVLYYEVYFYATPWHVYSSLIIFPIINPFPKFKDYLPKFLCNVITFVNDHLNSFSNGYHNIGSHDNHTCMHLFVNYLLDRVVANFDLPHNIFGCGMI